MVVVKVRETYDLHTVQNKMTVIAVHTPKPDIIKKNFPGLLLQCRAYRPLKADVRIACASVLPLDPLGVGTSAGDVAPEDVFNPILYRAMSNKGMSQLEARINLLAHSSGLGQDVQGNSATVDVDSVIDGDDDFPVYYGLLSNSHGWKKAHPQSGLSMSDLRPLVYEMNYNMGDSVYIPGSVDQGTGITGPNADLSGYAVDGYQKILGKSKPMPFLNCTAFGGTPIPSGFPDPDAVHGDYTPYNAETYVPYVNCVVAGICIPPSRLHTLYYRMVVTWDIEFSTIRPIGEITDWGGLTVLGNHTHYQNYSYSEAKKAITGDDSSILDKDACMVSANVNIDKVM